MLELLNQVRPELLITWAVAPLISLLVFINVRQPKKKVTCVSVPFKNGQGQVIGHVNYYSHVNKCK